MSHTPSDREAYWAALEQAFVRASDLDDQGQADLVAEMRAQNPQLADELAAMLGSDAGQKQLEDPEFDPDLVEPSQSVEEKRIGSRIGAYQVSGVIASGGMGDVLLAERADGEFEQTVAIKLLREGMQFGQFGKRFLQERQTLAQLQHLNIAGLIDGGSTEDGLPYLVMEYVDGQDLVEYCRGHQLRLRQIVELLLEICDAVQYAHEHLVVHRDLKPGNILVRSDGHPVLLDFGIAKLLDPEALGFESTQAQFPVMTPEYASPEQHRGEKVGTTSDIYSLGVVMYRLFSGHSPFELAGQTGFSIAQVVSEKSAPPLRSLVAKFPSDLDAIVLKCLRKEPDRRYRSAAGLAADLGRFLRGMPVEAKPDSTAYRLRRFVGRNQVPVALSALILIAGGVGLAAYIQQSEIAVRKALTTSRVSGFLLDFFKKRDPWAEGTANMTLDQFFGPSADLLLDDLQGEPEVRSELAASLGKVMLNLGDEQRAIDLLRIARGAWPEQLSLDPEAYADIQFDLGVAYRRSGELDLAETELQEVLQLRLQVFGDEHEKVASAWNTLGLVHHTMGRFDQAESEYQTALEMRRKLLGDDAVELGATLNNLGDLARLQEKYDLAIERFQSALTIQKRHYQGQDHPDIATTLNNLGIGFEIAGQLDQAERAFTKSLAMRRRILSPNHPYIASSLNNLGLLEDGRGNLQGAVDYFRQAMELARASAPAGHPLLDSIAYNLEAVEADLKAVTDG
jgi:eukaryotic-like serine/threonine-protein kinase